MSYRSVGRGRPTLHVAHLSSLNFIPRLGGVPSHIQNLVHSLPDINHLVLTVALPGLPAFEQPAPNLRVFRCGPVDMKTIRGSEPLERVYLRTARAAHLAAAAGELLRTMRFETILRREKPDVLHLHDIATHYGLRAARMLNWLRMKERLLRHAALCRLDLPRVFTDHSHLARTPADEDWRLHEADFEFAMLADEVICVEQAGERHFSEYTRETATRPRISHIPNSVDTQQFAFTPLPERDELVVGFAGRLSGVRGIALLTEVINAAPPGVRFNLAIGHSSPVLRREFTSSLVSDTPCHIEYGVNHAAMPDFLANIDVLFNPVKVQSISLASIEALAVGRPTVMLAIGDRGPTVDGLSGWLIKGKAEEATALFSKLRDDRDLIARAGREGRQLVEASYDNVRIGAQIREVYERCLALPRAGSGEWAASG